jgi:hypothetical protein
MRIGKRGILVLALCIITVCSLIIAVPLLMQSQPESPTDTESPDGQDTPNVSDLQNAVANGIQYCEGECQPYGLLFLNVMYRRFGITEFADAIERYDQMIPGKPNEPSLRVFRRIVDPDNQFQAGDMDALYEDVDVLTAPALYCDRYGLPDNYVEMLENAVNSGDYLLTHTVLALIWIKENYCEITLPDGFLENTYNKTAALMELYQINSDIAIESAAFLYLAGQGDLVDNSFIQQVISDQGADGGWGRNVDYRWHTTVLALLLLLHVEYPSNAYPPMLAPATK